MTVQFALHDLDNTTPNLFFSAVLSSFQILHFQQRSGHSFCDASRALCDGRIVVFVFLRVILAFAPALGILVTLLASSSSFNNTADEDLTCRT